ncbi:MAG: S-layer protein [Candidatus Aenigmarchaeota archaeon]|nr:S-layer protein [Candidatus Aenigmarchaeota archaeon]
MKKKNLLFKGNDGKYYSKNIGIFEHPKELAPASSELAWKILLTLNEKPMYPNDLAKKLKIHEQKIYYHINKMVKSELIEVVREESRHGAICKFFAPTSKAFGFELPGGETKVKMKSKSIEPHLKDFLYEFIKDDVFNGSIVVGSPVPHGPYLTAARDGHFAAQLGIFLGNFCSLERRFVVKLDTEVKAENAQRRNMILIGGPVTNMVFSDLNERLKVNFKWKREWIISSGDTEYTSESDGIIAKITNPWDETKKIIIFAGAHREATKTCIIALTQHYEKILKDYNKNKDFYRIIRGLDRDGDGKIDDIEILE